MVIYMNMEKIIELRNELELTQEQMANKLGCKRSAYSLWELNINTIPLEYLNKISNIFNVNIDYLANLSTEKNILFNAKEIDPLELGKRIKQARKAMKLTQEKLALKLNTTHSVISAYESGKTAVPTLFIIEIAKITNSSLNWLLDKI